MGSLTKALIGKEDVDVADDEQYPSTFNRLTSVGSTMSLTSFPDIWKTHQSIINAKYYGSATGSTLGTAVAAGTTSRDIYIEGGEWVITESYDWSAYTTTRWIFAAGSYLNIAAGCTVTFPSPWNVIAQPNQQIFSGTGTVVFTKAGVVYPHWWGAKGDGTTNDDTTVQAALTAAEGGTIDFGDSEYTYLITTPLTLLSNTTVISKGATIDASGFATGSKRVLSATGTLGTAKNITVGTAPILSYYVTVDSVVGLSAGDYVIVTSNDHIGYNSAGADTVDYGEILVIREISGMDVYFTTPLNYTYTTTPLLYPVTWKEDIHIRGLRIVGSNTLGFNHSGIQMLLVNRFSIKDCVIDNCDAYSISVCMSCVGDVESNTIHGVFYTTGGGVSVVYGVILWNCTQYVNVTNNIGHRLRHLVVTVSTETPNYFGQPMFCNVIGNICFDAEAGDDGRSYAYENHGHGTHILWANNIADGCYSGFNIENGTYNTVTGNIIKNYSNCGILIGGDGIGATNLVISNNQIMGMTNEMSGEAGIYVQNCAGTFNNLIISGNTIRYPHNSDGWENGINISPNASYVNCVIENNHIYNDAESNLYQIYLAADSGVNTTDGWNILNNSIYGSQYGIAVYGDRCVVRGNIIRNSAAAASGYGVYSNGTNNVIDNNTLIYIRTGIATGLGAVTNIVKDNVTVDCTTATSYLAVGSVIAPATIIAHIAGAEMHYDI